MKIIGIIVCFLSFSQFLGASGGEFPLLIRSIAVKSPIAGVGVEINLSLDGLIEKFVVTWKGKTIVIDAAELKGIKLPDLESLRITSSLQNGRMPDGDSLEDLIVSMDFGDEMERSIADAQYPYIRVASTVRLIFVDQKYIARHIARPEKKGNRWKCYIKIAGAKEESSGVYSGITHPWSGGRGRWLHEKDD